MNKLARFYNQNRKGIWYLIIVVAFVIIIIQFFNSYYARRKEKENAIANSPKNQTINKDRSEAMVQGSIASTERKKEYEEVIDSFLEYCSNGEIDKAYKLVANSCKEKLYPTQQAFEKKYYEANFDGNKIYDFQLWSATKQTYIYLVKIYDNMLSSGVSGEQEYMQDYYSVIKEDNVYRISISSYVKHIEYGEEDDDDISNIPSTNVDDIKVSITGKDCYMDYEIYQINVANFSDNDILLDSLTTDDTIFVKDEKQVSFNAMTIELNQEELVVEKESSKNFEIKIARSYTSSLDVEKIIFSKVIKNYEQYKENIQEYQDYIKIEVDFTQK